MTRDALVAYMKRLKRLDDRLIGGVSQQHELWAAPDDQERALCALMGLGALCVLDGGGRGACLIVQRQQPPRA